MTNSFDGLTILRYAHIFRDRISGGSEQYLSYLNRQLLLRNRMTILQTHLVGCNDPLLPIEETIGLGRLVWIPIRTVNTPVRTNSFGLRLKIARGNGTLWNGLLRLLRNRGGHLRYSALIASEHLIDLLGSRTVQLLVAHWYSYDLNSLFNQAVRLNVPFAYINHFENSRLFSSGVRPWLCRAAAIGGVSARNVPAEIAARYVNLSDAIDTGFFSRENAFPEQFPLRPLILLPSRITAGKGHLDLLRAFKVLSSKAAYIGFAGAIDSPNFATQLEKLTAELGLSDRVLYFGQLSAENLRSCYAASTAVVLPSSSEGLGRVLLEAQAMKVPVIAYDTGGMPEAMQNNVTGFLVISGDIDKLACHLDLLLNDNALCRKMGQMGREFVSKEFSPTSLVKRHEAFYTQALNQSHK